MFACAPARMVAELLMQPSHQSASVHVVASINRPGCYQPEPQLLRGVRTRQREAPYHGARNFETIRQTAFPLLDWGRDVTDQIPIFPSEYLKLAFTRLANLDDIVRHWRSSGSAEPDQGNLVFRNESTLTMDNYGNQRRFRSASGEMKTYEQHVRINQGNRIHFIIDVDARSIEIGYIGKHLRTWNH